MKKLLIATSIALALSASSAFAVTQQSGVYIGALGGWSFAKSPSTGNVAANSSSNRNYTWGGNLGYQYAFTPHTAGGLEVGYVNFGQTNYNYNNSTNNFNIKNSGVQVMAVANYLIDNGINFFGKAGAIDQQTKISGNYNGGGRSTTEWLPAVAAGVGYMPLQNLNVALQYEYTFGDNWNSIPRDPKPMTQNAVTLGVTYTFPL